MALVNTQAVSVVSWDTRTVIDRSYGALGLRPQQITTEMIQIAQDLLALGLADLINVAAPLWTVEKILAPMVAGQEQLILPVGTSDINRSFHRTINNVTPPVFTSTTAAYTFDFGVVNGVSNPVQVYNWSITWAGVSVPVTFQTSPDNATWTNVGTSRYVDVGVTGVVWYDMAVVQPSRYWRVIPTVVVPPNTLSITVANVYNTPSDLEMYRLNKDDYWNMTNKAYQGRPLQYKVNRFVSSVTMDLWPVPDATAAMGVFFIHRERHIMDVGTLQQTLEVPTRWYYTVVFMLADALSFATPESDPARCADVRQRYNEMKVTTWTSERDRAPIKFNTNISQYTR